MEEEADERNAHFAFVADILATIKAQPHEVKVIIPHSWRESFSLDQMCEQLGESGTLSWIRTCFGVGWQLGRPTGGSRGVDWPK